MQRSRHAWKILGSQKQKIVDTHLRKIRRGVALARDDGATTVSLSRSGRTCSISKVFLDCTNKHFTNLHYISQLHRKLSNWKFVLSVQKSPIRDCLRTFGALRCCVRHKYAATPGIFITFANMLSSQSAASMDQVWFAAARQCSLHTSNCSLHQTHQRRKGSGKLIQSKARASHSDGATGEKVLRLILLSRLQASVVSASTP